MPMDKQLGPSLLLSNKAISMLWTLQESCCKDMPLNVSDRGSSIQLAAIELGDN